MSILFEIGDRILVCDEGAIGTVHKLIGEDSNNPFVEVEVDRTATTITTIIVAAKRVHLLPYDDTTVVPLFKQA